MENSDTSFNDNAAYHTFSFEYALISCVFWAVAFPLLVKFFGLLANIFCSYMPPSCAFIPKSLPHANPPGSAIPFEIPLETAKDKQLLEFMQYRKKLDWKPADGLHLVAIEAAKYKAELFDEKSLKWEDEHFRLRLPGLKFPFPDKHWNGWSGFWLEVGPYNRGKMLGNIVLGIEHFVVGLILPMNYLYGDGLPRNFAWAMYADIGANVVESLLVFMSYATKENYTVTKYSRAIWPLILMHHISAIGMCSLGLYLGDTCPRALACELIIALLGTTGAGHLMMIVIDFTPFAFPDSPVTRLLFGAVLTGAMIWFRAIYWINLAYKTIVISSEVSDSWIVLILTTVSLLLFTAFNLDFIKYHVKSVMASWKKFQASSKHN
jgi:hypothetical protein